MDADKHQWFLGYDSSITAVTERLGARCRVCRAWHGFPVGLLRQREGDTSEMSGDQVSARAQEVAVAYGRESDPGPCPGRGTEAAIEFRKALGAKNGR